MEDEKWLPVPGYSGRYEVSNLGRVRATDWVIPNSRGSGTRTMRGREIKSSDNSNGYRYVSLRVPNGPGCMYKHEYVHRLVATVHIRPALDLEVVNHLDSNRANNNVKNLEWTSHKGNMEHASKNGRMHGDTAARRTKLSQAQVDQIRAIGALSVIPQHVIASMFDVAVMTVNRILRGLTWAYGDQRGVRTGEPCKRPGRGQTWVDIT